MAALLATVTGLDLMNIDEWRHGQERMDPAEYLSVSYYEHWLHSVLDLLNSKGLLLTADFDARLGLLREKEA